MKIEKRVAVPADLQFRFEVANLLNSYLCSVYLVGISFSDDTITIPKICYSKIMTLISKFHCTRTRDVIRVNSVTNTFLDKSLSISAFNVMSRILRPFHSQKLHYFQKKKHNNSFPHTPIE